MATHTRGRGTKFYRGVDGVYTQLARVVNLKPPGRQRQTFNIEDIDDLNDGFAGGNVTPGEATVTLRFSAEEATQETLEGDVELADITAPNAITYKIELADAASQIFSAILTNWDPQQIERNGDVQVQVSFQATGDVPFAA